MTKDTGQRTTQAVDLLRRLIAIPRISRQEAASADLLQSYMLDRGLDVHRHGNNLWSIQPPVPGRPTLLLNAHIDTVRPVAAWTRDPHSPDLEGDVLYGIGSNDDGASLVTLLHVFLDLVGSTTLPWNLVFLASAEEEVSGRDGIESVLPLLPHIDFALVGEPTGMQPAVAEKGLMVLDITAHGRAGHAARDEGDNAIYHALDAIDLIRRYRFDRVSPLLGPVKATTTIISAGTQHNVIPDHCTFTVDVRSNELYTNAEILQLLRQALPSCDVTPRSLRLGSSQISLQHPLVQRIIAQGRQPFGSPTLSDQALMPFPSLKMGPGDSRRSHTADEYILLSEISEAITLYTAILS